MVRILDDVWTFRSPTAWGTSAIEALTRLIPILLTFAPLATVPVRAQEPARPASRAEATAIIANARKIVTPNGVEQSEKVRIGGIDQWVSVRGADPQESSTAIYPRRARVRLDPDELVVLPRLGRIFHSHPVGPARHRKNLSPY